MLLQFILEISPSPFDSGRAILANTKTALHLSTKNEFCNHSSLHLPETSSSSTAGDVGRSRLGMPRIDREKSQPPPCSFGRGSPLRWSPLVLCVH